MSLRSSSRAIFVSVMAWLLALVGAGHAATTDPLDWPNWRGPQQNRVSMEKGLIDKWNPEGGEGSNVLWKRPELGGRSTPIVMRGKLYTIVRDQPESKTEGEKVVCVDAATGEPIWEHRFNVYLSEVPADRVGWSSACGDPETGRIYAQGVSGYFCCLEGETGKLVWDRSLHEEFGLISTYGGRTNVPVIFEDTLLISSVIVGWGDEPKWGGFARPAHRFMAFDKATGELRWLNGTGISPYDTTYSTPTVLPIGGQAALVFSSGDGGVWALQPRTGKAIWNFPFGRAGINISPLVTADGRVYVSHSVENTFGTSMGSVAALDGTKSGDLTGKEIWRVIEKVMAGNSSPVMLDGRLYIVDDRAKLFVFDAKTGKQITRKALGSTMRSTPLVADGKIYLCTGSGQWYVLKPTENGVEVVNQLRLRGEENDSSPIVSHGRIYLATSENLYCLGMKDKQPEADPMPPLPKEEPITDHKIATIQVVPFDVVLKPGGKQKYNVRLFNARGQALPQSLASGATFALDGPGKVSASGAYEAPTDNAHQATLVRCKVGDTVGTARLRVIPPLPWKFDFNTDKNVPLTWLGGRIRWEVRGENGEKFIAKKTVLPTPKDPKNKLGTRSYLWMGPRDLANYTIQADVLLNEQDGKMPDVGLIASGYEIMVRSLNNKLRLDSWSSNDYREFAEASFAPKPGQWYTLKLSVVPEGRDAIVRGKVWQRGQTEPREWTIQMVDKAPNLSGTPGVFGNSPDAEIFLDNLQVTSN